MGMSLRKNIFTWNQQSCKIVDSHKVCISFQNFFLSQFSKEVNFSNYKNQYKSYLFWYLSKVVYKSNGCIFLQGIINTVYIHIAFIEEMMEHIDSIFCCLTLLFVAKDQVYPLMEVGTNVVWLKGLGKIKVKLKW